MKLWLQLCLVFSLLLATATTARPEITLAPGDSYVLNFDSLGWYEPFPGTNSFGSYELHLSQIEAGSRILCEVWENELAGAPIHTAVFTNDALPYGRVTDAFADKGGTLRVSLLSGLVSIRFIEISVVTEVEGAPGGGGMFKGIFSPEPTPPRLNLISVPSALLLRWQTNGSSFGYVLETANQIDAENWEFVGNAPVVSGKLHTVVTNDNSAARFYRLRK